NLQSRDKYSQFFETLTDRGYHLSYNVADDSKLILQKNNVYVCDHLILLAPSVEEFGGQFSVEELTTFIDTGHNILVATNTNIGAPIRELAVECGFEYDQPGTYAIDHFNYDNKDQGKHTLIWGDSSDLVDSKIIVGNTKKPILYQGIGLIRDPDNKLAFDVLTARSTAFSYSPDALRVTTYPHASGRGLSLVAAVQALNDARVAFTGSDMLFSNAFFGANVKDGLTGKSIGPSGNKEFAVALSKWIFKETGVLRAGNVTHHKIGGIENPLSYTITDDVIYEIDIETLNDKGRWVPYVAKDIQIEFVRIDPFIRTGLSYKGGKYTAKFKLPDVYGVFQFKVDYLRKGYTHLFITKQVSVKPFQHTQYERFIPTAYPYYTSAFLMMVMVYLLVFMVLYDKEDKKTKSD
ncbi:unnamed protein product, partial [Gordionus sp. m RMFG-2023]